MTELRKQHYRTVRVRPIAAGVKDSRNQTLLEDGHSPDAENVEFDRDSIASSRGAIKLNNQAAPKSCVQTRVSSAPLSFAAKQSVPARGYVYLPYNQDLDLGGDFKFYDNPGGFTGDSFHARRGRSFDVSCSVRIPADEKVFGPTFAAASGPAVYSTLSAGDKADVDEFTALGGYDEAMDEFVTILQKGGNRMSPMSWAIGIVNASNYEYATGQPALDRPSNYAICFMWLDVPQWGAGSPVQMRYKVGTGSQPNVGTTGSYSTLGYRAILGEFFLEPGRNYSVSVGLELDTGTPGDPTVADPSASWNGDGEFEINVRDDAGVVTRLNNASTEMTVIRGPTDSIEYLMRYGIRYSGRDAVFGGLGLRQNPFKGSGFLPYGLDSAALEYGGHRMLSVGDEAEPAQYAAGGGTPLTCSHVASAAGVTVNSRALNEFSHQSDASPFSPDGARWLGLGDAGAAIHNPDAMRGYWGVLWNTGDAVLNGLRFKLGTYTEPASVGTFDADLSTATKAWTNEPFFPICFRWNQRPLAISNIVINKSRADYSRPRKQLSLGMEREVDDTTEPGHNRLQAVWALDDAGGGTLREKVKGWDGFLAPFALGQPSDGQGVFLSGEGEAVMLDLAKNPVLRRELRQLMRSGAGGFAIELRMVLTEASYALDDATGSERLGQYAPHIASWEFKPDEGGYETRPAPLIRLSHKARIPTATGSEPFYFPMGFTLEAATLHDQEAGSLTAEVQPWTGSAPIVNKWSKDASWVGREIRIQFGIESTGTADEFNIYLAATPKEDLFPEDGDPAQAEFAYYTTKTIPRKDIERLIVVIGGSWEPSTEGYSEMNCPMILREVRVFGTAAPGALPSTSGGVVAGRDGKLVGDKALPEGILRREDLLHAITAAGSNINVTRSSATITPASGTSLFTGEPEDGLAALKETYLLVSGDGLEVRKDYELPEEIQEFYFVESVAAGGVSAALANPFNDESRENAFARSFRLFGYSSLQDDVEDRRLTTGKGTPFVPGSAEPSDAQIAVGFFSNLAPTAIPFDLRVQCGQIAASEIVPTWARSPCIPRRNPILSIASLNDKSYCSAKGGVFEADDRWRRDGPHFGVKNSFHFRARRLGATDILLPLESDRVIFGNAGDVYLTAANLLDVALIFDFWVKLDTIGEFQTMLWVGNVDSNPLLDAGDGTAAHEMSYQVRLNRGVPEFVVGSSVTYDGASRPEKGLFIARADARLKPDVWTHIRWEISESSNATPSIEDPVCYLMGRQVSVGVNGRDSLLAAPAWLSYASMPTPAGSGEILMGCSRDAYAAPETGDAFAEGFVAGPSLLADRVFGYVHSLGGQLAHVVVDTRPDP